MRCSGVLVVMVVLAARAGESGHGLFVDVSLSSGMRSSASPGLGVVCWDFNGDHRLDFFVANDGAANQLWVNGGDGKFEDEAIIQGVAFNELGQAEAGSAAGDVDVDGDSDLDLFVTNLTSETNTLYSSEGAVGFEDATARVGLAANGLRWTGFSTGFLDFDPGGDLDLGGQRSSPETSGTPQVDALKSACIIGVAFCLICDILHRSQFVVLCDRCGLFSAHGRDQISRMR